MWLIDVEALELVAVRDDAVPTYAILSHTWGDEELTFQEMESMRGYHRFRQTLDKRKRSIAAKLGYGKVARAAKLAASRGFAYLWVDTCCIDKASSAELSEAINSMYEWYAGAAECFALLADVLPAKVEDLASEGSTFRRSRWFSRGWTLQEMVAPKMVLFYAQDWTLLGSKRENKPLKRVVSLVTGIHEEVLDGTIDPMQLSVATRMQWAAHRRTTRAEDIAYCLMGLFQVNMPLLYGEGKRAFTRLQEEILQRTDDQSIFAWNTAKDPNEDPDALHGLLAQSPANFAYTKDIQPLPPSPIYSSAPSSMTNYGLRVRMNLFSASSKEESPMEDDYYAILDCYVMDGDQYMCPTIRLRRLTEDQYGRLEPSQVRLTPPPQTQGQLEGQSGYTMIFVRQQPVYYHIPEFRLARDWDKESLQVTDICPARQWNSTTLTMKVTYSRRLKAMGLFRFKQHSWKGGQVDVLVGLRRLDNMSWEGFCFQRLGGAESPERTLAAINRKIEEVTKTEDESISSWRLRELLGEDAKLTTDASVKGLQLQGRLYISVSVFEKREIGSSREISTVGNGSIISPRDKISLIRIPLLQSFQALQLTASCVEVDELQRHVLMLPDPVEVGEFKVRVNHKEGNMTPSESMARYLQQYIEMLRDRFDLDDFWGLAAKIAQNPQEEQKLTDKLAVASFDGDTVKMESLIDRLLTLKGRTLDAYGFTPLHWAVAGRSVAAIRLIIAVLEGEGDDAVSSCTTNMGLNLLHVAVMLGYPLWEEIPDDALSSVSWLKIASARVDKWQDTASHLVAAFAPSNESYSAANFFNSLSFFISPKSPLFTHNKDDETLLHRAAACDNAEVISHIGSTTGHRHRIDETDRHGRSPLWHAAASNSYRAIRALLDLGAEISLADDLGRTPLHVACRGGCLQAVEMLVSFGAPRTSQTAALGLTPLDMAVLSGKVQVVAKILERNPARIESATNQGKSFHAYSSYLDRCSALHIAASIGEMSIVRWLCLDSMPSHTYERPGYFRRVYTATSAFWGFELVEGSPISTRDAAALLGHDEIVDFFDSMGQGPGPNRASLARARTSGPYSPTLAPNDRAPADSNQNSPAASPVAQDIYFPPASRMSASQKQSASVTVPAFTPSYRMSQQGAPAPYKVPPPGTSVQRSSRGAAAPARASIPSYPPLRDVSYPDRSWEGDMLAYEEYPTSSLTPDTERKSEETSVTDTLLSLLGRLKPGYAILLAPDMVTGLTLRYDDFKNQQVRVWGIDENSDEDEGRPEGSLRLSKPIAFELTADQPSKYAASEVGDPDSYPSADSGVDVKEPTTLPSTPTSQEDDSRRKLMDVD